MEVSSAQVIKGLCEIFDECETMALSAKTLLGDLPEWDSMAAVNLQTYLQQHFEVEVPLEMLADETSLEEITLFLTDPDSLQAGG